jgi:hypothetical protein
MMTTRQIGAKRRCTNQAVLKRADKLKLTPLRKLGQYWFWSERDARRLLSSPTPREK